MQRVIPIIKPIGRTPLQVTNDFKEKYPEYRDQTISYAGRLDPMAEGLMLLLVGDENKKRKQYEELPKTYEFSLVLGIATDTYDLMGMITSVSRKPEVVSRETQSIRPSTADRRPYTPFHHDLSITTKRILSILPMLSGDLTLPYPPYSSRTVNGKPLYWYARNSLLQTIQIPTKKVQIGELSLLSSTLFPIHSLLDHIFRIIPEVQGDFRQDEILQIWRNASPRFPTYLPHYSFIMTCTSGTYVRQIVHEIGEKLGVPTVTSSLKRIRIGDYALEDALQNSG